MDVLQIWKRELNWFMTRACSRYPQGFNDESKVNECQEDEIQFFESGEDPAEAFEPSEEPFDFISLLVEFFVVAPRIESVGLGRDHWNHAQVEYKLPRFIAFICLIHQQWQAFRHRTQVFEQQPALRSIMLIAG